MVPFIWECGEWRKKDSDDMVASPIYWNNPVKCLQFIYMKNILCMAMEIIKIMTQRAPKRASKKLTFVSLNKHLITKSENFSFLVAIDSFDVGDSHLEGSKGCKRLIRTRNNAVCSAFSCIGIEYSIWKSQHTPISTLENRS